MTLPVILNLLLLAPGQATPDARTVLESALRNYDQAVALRDASSPEAAALYEQALAGFQSVINAGVANGHLHYNAGNAQMRLGRIGSAIASFRRAQDLMPGDRNVKRNLSFARSLRELEIQATATTALTETLFFWHHETSPALRTQVALFSYVLFWLLLTARMMSRRRLAVFKWCAVVAAIVALATGLSVAQDMRTADEHTEGVITASGVTLRKGNSEEYQPQLDRPLPEGIEFEVLEQRPDLDANVWYRVRLRNGKDGWLRADQTELI